MTEPQDVASLAAIVGRQSLDLNVYASFLLNSLVDALGPEYVQVERRRSAADRLRGREATVVSVSVSIGDQRFTLSRPNQTATPKASVSHIVSGIVLRTEPQPLDAWSLGLAAALSGLAERNADAATALARITSMEV